MSIPIKKLQFEIDLIKNKWQNNDLILREELENIIIIFTEIWSLSKLSIEPLMHDQKVSTTMSIFFSSSKFIFPEQQEEIEFFWGKDNPTVINLNNIILKVDNKISILRAKKIIDVYQYYKNSSPNLLNFSMDLNLKDAIKLEEKYNNSIIKTAINLKTFFINKHNIGAKIITLNSLNIGSNIHRKLETSIIEHLKLVINNILKYQKPYFFKIQNEYFLIFPFCNDRNTFKAKYIFLFRSKKSFKKHILSNLNKSTNYYFNSFLPKQRLNHLSDFQNSIINLHSDKTKLLNGINFNEELRNSSKKLFSQIHNFTDISSVTLRLYNPFDNSLDICFESSLFERINKKEDKITFDNSESINLNVFRNCNIDNSFYCRDITKYKEIISKNQFLADFDRKASITELCMPIFFKKTKIGTINFESSSGFGFGKDMNTYIYPSFGKIVPNNEIKKFDIPNYCITLRNLIQEYGEVLYENNDKFWLIERLQNYQNIHELKSLITDKKLSNLNKKIIQNAIEVVQFDNSQEGTNLKNMITEAIEFYSLNSENLGWRKKVVIKQINLNLDSHTKVYLQVLIKNIIKNFRDNCNDFVNYEKLYFAYDAKNKIFICQMIFRFINFSKSKEFFYLNRPYNVEKQSTFQNSIESHIGFFLIGVITRQLKGFCFLSKPESIKNQLSILRIQIPLSIKL